MRQTQTSGAQDMPGGRPAMTAVVAGRCATVVVGLVMTVYLLTRSPVVRFDEPFFVPDVLAAVLLTGSAALPARAAVPAMIFAHASTAGIVLVSCFTRLLRGDAAGANFLLVGVSTVTAALLGYAISRSAAPS